MTKEMEAKISTTATRLASATNTTLIICYLLLILTDRDYITFLKVPATIVIAINIPLAFICIFMTIKNRSGIEKFGGKIFFASVTFAGSVLLLCLYLGLI